MVFECEAMVVVVASGVRHCIATGQYRFLRSECEELAKYFKVRSLRDPRKEPSRLRELCAIEPTGATEPHLHLHWNSFLPHFKCDYEVSCKEVDHLMDICLSPDGVYNARITDDELGGSLVVLNEPNAISPHACMDPLSAILLSLFLAPLHLAQILFWEALLPPLLQASFTHAFSRTE
ncbi:galactokinase [Echinococcus multilocularis]|uniref:Galactokinase n=1 Tax=Echinococcus multilocularis TaxID=6211 RepID=A0A0S4MM18_ECHMU|nr:galactokinase [Echinococcus multilocularis]